MTHPDARSRRGKAQRLRALHHAPDILVLVNVWDVASARTVAAQAGCTAIATASDPVAAAHGYPDGEHIPVSLMLQTVAQIVAATDLPVTVDLEAGYGDVDTTVRTAAQIGAVGANLEDRMDPLHDAVPRIQAAVRVADSEGVPLVLNARTDAYLHGGGHDDQALAEARTRGTAYLDAGASCVFVPGCVDADHLRSLADTFGPGRLSVLGMPGGPSPAELQGLGVARVSFGPFPHRHVMRSLAAAADEALATRPLP
jgi:2-methylisocitrate lyase-like PEP mutase family enzyme